MILLDTHVLLWLSQDDKRLGRRARGAIERAFRGDGVAISAISFWELAMLAARGRIRLRATVDDFRSATMESGIVEIPVDGGIAILSSRLALRGDHSDRIIVATAMARRATLATADEAILGMTGDPKRIAAQR